MGAYIRDPEIKLFESTLKKLGVDLKREEIKDGFFNGIKSVVIGKKRFWFDVVYGGAYLSELLHVACTLGAKKIIQIGSCGALRESIKLWDLVLPSKSYGNESTTRAYAPDATDNFHLANKELQNDIRLKIPAGKNSHSGEIISNQAMLAESLEDVEKWRKEGFIGVEMESATTFAVANHFKVPAASLLFVSDNLVKRELVTDMSSKRDNLNKTETKEMIYKIGLNTLTLDKKG